MAPTAASRPANDPLLLLLKERGFVPAESNHTVETRLRQPVYAIDPMAALQVRQARIKELRKAGRGLPKLGASLPTEALDAAGRAKARATKAKAMQETRELRGEQVQERLAELVADVKMDAARRCAMIERRFDKLGIFDHEANHVRAQSISFAALRKQVSADDLRRAAETQVAAHWPRPNAAERGMRLSVSQKLLRDLNLLDSALLADEAKGVTSVKMAAASAAPRRGGRSRRAAPPDPDGHEPVALRRATCSGQPSSGGVIGGSTEPRGGRQAGGGLQMHASASVPTALTRRPTKAS